MEAALVAFDIEKGDVEMGDSDARERVEHSVGFTQGMRGRRHRLYPLKLQTA